MFPKKKTPTRSYQFKLARDERLQWFQELTTKAARKLLEELWTEEWIQILGDSKLKAYKVINEAQMVLPNVYLPSRVRRGGAEWVGRLLRNQYKRMNCYYDCLEIVNWLGVETKDSKLLAIVMQHYRTKSKNGKTYSKYKKVMVQQTIAMIKNWYEKLAIDFSMFSYTDFVQPKISYFAFPYGPDDGQAIQYFSDEQTIHLKMKLPKTAEPRSISDWEWVEQELTIPEKIQEKIAQANSQQPKKPNLRTKILKGGLEYFFLQFPYEYPKEPKRNGKERVLAIDHGLKKIATAVVCEGGKQIAKPIMIKFKGSEYKHIEHLYDNIGGVQSKIAEQKKRRKNKQFGVKRREEERNKLYQKRNRLGEELAHTTTNILIQLALKWQCSKIIIEDLRGYKPPKGRRSWSRRLSEWLRGKLAFLLDYKCQEKGLTLVKVCPWNTSTHCPRCTAKGQKILGPNNLTADKKGRWFHCEACGFTADRDYIAAINIYRASFIDYKEIKSLKDTSPVPYTDSGTLHSTAPSGGSEMNYTNTIVVVTGNG
ncbi:MAG: hypothetical protein E3J70_02375 [Candidatus Heimdallarchaeota archaeon]|nr:MAG: hypothetical protein E3J70_02375 [Candidatus Heimdallarchaeota archaeon]